MHIDYVPLAVGLLIFLSSLVSLKFGISVAVVEIILGVMASAFGLKAESWMIYIAGFGGILATFLAGTEVDTKLMQEKFKESFFIGSLSFLCPFSAAFLYTFYIAHWELQAALIAGVTLSTTSLAVVYSVLVETNLARTTIGKLLMAATFITNIESAFALSILFMKPNFYTILFFGGSIVVIILATKFSHVVFDNPKLKNKVIEPEIKYVFLLLLLFSFFAQLGNGHAILPAFLLGLLMSKHFAKSIAARSRFRTVAYAFITPIFFIVGGLKVSLPMIVSCFGLFAILFIIKILAKFLGVYFLTKKFIPNGSMYITLLMSTGLTFGAIASVFGFMSGIINQTQYSVLIGVVIASAVIPTFIAQKWFMPVEDEDLVG